MDFLSKLTLFTCMLLIIVSCTNNKHKVIEKEKYFAKTQKQLFEILDNYKTEYSKEIQQKSKEKIFDKYYGKIFEFLSDSLGGFIDSMTVIVDTVIQNGWMVTTQFHTRDIEFKYGMRFQDSMDSRNGSLYKFMKELRPGEEITVDFIHLGAGELSYPDETSTSTLRIFAFPYPLSFREKNKLTLSNSIHTPERSVANVAQSGHGFRWLHKK
jgi:hypothetical protein